MLKIFTKISHFLFLNIKEIKIYYKATIKETLCEKSLLFEPDVQKCLEIIQPDVIFNLRN